MSTPEHNFSLKYDAWELTVFDNAIYYTAITVKGRGGRTRLQSTDLLEILRQAAVMPRTCVYAVTKAGRSIVLDVNKWPFWQARYMVAKGLLQKRSVVKKPLAH